MHYSYAMQVCMRYTQSAEEAQEVVNDAFMKVFKNLKSYDVTRVFLPWLKQILVRTAINHYRKNINNIEQVTLYDDTNSKEVNKVSDDMTYQEILGLVRKLSPAYQAVFNLYAIEGYKHHEIAEMLGISVGTSKSNYARAKDKLRDYLETYFEMP